MKIVIVVVAFAVTVGGLFLFENYKTPPKEEDYAQIVRGLANQNQSKTPTPKPTIKSGTVIVKTPTPSPVQSFTPAPATFLPPASPAPVNNQQITPDSTSSPQATPMPVRTATITPESTPAPAPTATATSTGHIYYTSSYATAKNYYCDTDNAWKTLSTKYLKSFSSPEELLKSYPTRTLREPCK